MALMGGMDKIAEALEKNRTLTRLAIVSVALEIPNVDFALASSESLHICGAIENVLKYNKSIIELDLSMRLWQTT